MSCGKKKKDDRMFLGGTKLQMLLPEPRFGAYGRTGSVRGGDSREREGGTILGHVGERREVEPAGSSHESDSPHPTNISFGEKPSE